VPLSVVGQIQEVLERIRDVHGIGVFDLDAVGPYVPLYRLHELPGSVIVELCTESEGDGAGLRSIAIWAPENSAVKQME
jgi:hypothetical protein